MTNWHSRGPPSHSLVNEPSPAAAAGRGEGSAVTSSWASGWPSITQTLYGKAKSHQAKNPAAAEAAAGQGPADASSIGGAGVMPRGPSRLAPYRRLAGSACPY